jgi:hypothetical protein
MNALVAVHSVAGHRYCFTSHAITKFSESNGLEVADGFIVVSSEDKILPNNLLYLAQVIAKDMGEF